MGKTNGISRRQWIAARLCTGTLVALPRGPGQALRYRKLKEKRWLTLANFPPHPLFEGTCQQAMEFYKSCFGGELRITKVKDFRAKQWMPVALHDKVINAQLRSENVNISASDWLRPDRTPIRGNTLCLFLSGGTLPELRSLFERLWQGAEVTDPLKEMFFARYGAPNDKFGVRWMFQTNEKE